MATDIVHAKRSAKHFGGVPEDYIEIHRWFDSTKGHLADFRHRALRHHAEGIALCIQVFGDTITISTGRQVPTRWVAEQHVKEDFNNTIPTAADWLRCIRPEPWMSKGAMPLSEDDQ